MRRREDGSVNAAIDPAARERVEVQRMPDLAGVEVLLVDDCARRWTAIHTTYSICTGLAIGRPAPWRYRGRVHLQPADGISLMEPGEVHTNTVQTDVASFRVLFIDPAAMDGMARELGLPGAPHLRIAQTDGRGHPELRRALLSLHRSLEGPATVLERQSLYAAAAQLLLTEAAERPPRELRPVRAVAEVGRACEFIEAHMAEPISLAELTAAAGSISRFHLVRAFNAVLGLPPHAYQLQLRIARARSLLRSGVPPAEAAVTLGFADQSHFGRHFRRTWGMTPREYALAHP